MPYRRILLCLAVLALGVLVLRHAARASFTPEAISRNPASLSGRHIKDGQMKARCRHSFPATTDSPN